MLKKRYIKSRNVWKIYFELSGSQLAEDIEIRNVNMVGDFSGWNRSNTPMKTGRGDVYKAVLELQPGTTCQFRYLVNGKFWLNDESADSYTPSGYGEDNCVLMLGNES
jgi:hypothetical protein